MRKGEADDEPDSGEESECQEFSEDFIQTAISFFDVAAGINLVYYFQILYIRGPWAGIYQLWI